MEDNTDLIEQISVSYS